MFLKDRFYIPAIRYCHNFIIQLIFMKNNTPVTTIFTDIGGVLLTVVPEKKQ